MLFILTARWKEPCPGSATWLCDLTNEEVKQVQSVLDWLEEHAKGEYGYALCEWELHPSRTKWDKADLDSLDAVLDTIALTRPIWIHSMLFCDSRYNETDVPGDFYGATHPDLDGR